jgi:hypothetical protein
MRQLVTTLILLAAAPIFAAPVAFSPNPDKGTTPIVVAGDTAEFSRPAMIMIKAGTGREYKLENEGDSVVLSGTLEVKGKPGQTQGNLRLALLTGQPTGNTGWLGYFVVMPEANQVGNAYRREGSGAESGSYMAYASSIRLPVKKEGALAKTSLIAGRFAFTLKLTKTTTGTDYLVSVTSGDTLVMAFEGTDPKPNTFRFDTSAFLINYPNADKVKFSNVDISFHKADQPKDTTPATPADTGNKSLTPILIAVGVILLAAAVTAVVVIRRRRETPSAVVVPPPPPSSLPPPPGA